MNKILLIVLIIAVCAFTAIQLFTGQKANAANTKANQNSDKACIELTKSEFLKKVVPHLTAGARGGKVRIAYFRGGLAESEGRREICFHGLLYHLVRPLQDGCTYTRRTGQGI